MEFPKTQKIELSYNPVQNFILSTYSKKRSKRIHARQCSLQHGL